MTVIELIPRLLHDDVRVRLLAVELVRTNGNRAVTNCIVNNLVRRLSIQDAQRRLYAAEALVCLGGVAVNQVTYRLLKSRSCPDRGGCFLRRPHLRSNVLDATVTASNGSTKTRVRCRIL
jgi:hypothetical protein